MNFTKRNLPDTLTTPRLKNAVSRPRSSALLLLLRTNKYKKINDLSRFLAAHTCCDAKNNQPLYAG
ncbi:hypothetical protein [Burkholderia ubonensis]|uniref:hypothetical protein n=1 Tax=Burkholderia ubonensis TaxID=101571 RepID=UPI0012FC1447|nr:hypothetical protein [Burkholderia ubonensis]